MSLRKIFRVTLRDRVRNLDIKGALGIKKTTLNIIGERQLKWFGKGKPIGALVYCAYSGDFQDKRSKGRPPKKRRKDQIKQELQIPVKTAERYA